MAMLYNIRPMPSCRTGELVLNVKGTVSDSDHFLFLTMTVSLNVGTCFSNFSAEPDPLYITFVYHIVYVFDSGILLIILK